MTYWLCVAAALWLLGVLYLQAWTINRLRVQVLVLGQRIERLEEDDHD